MKENSTNTKENEGKSPSPGKGTSPEEKKPEKREFLHEVNEINKLTSNPGKVLHYSELPSNKRISGRKSGLTKQPMNLLTQPSQHVPLPKLILPEEMTDKSGNLLGKRNETSGEIIRKINVIKPEQNPNESLFSMLQKVKEINKNEKVVESVNYSSSSSEEEEESEELEEEEPEDEEDEETDEEEIRNSRELLIKSMSGPIARRSDKNQLKNSPISLKQKKRREKNRKSEKKNEKTNKNVGLGGYKSLSDDEEEEEEPEDEYEIHPSFQPSSLPFKDPSPIRDATVVVKNYFPIDKVYNIPIRFSNSHVLPFPSSPFFLSPFLLPPFSSPLSISPLSSPLSFFSLFPLPFPSSPLFPLLSFFPPFPSPF